MTKEGERSANYFGSLTQSSTVRLGTTAAGQDVNIPLGNLLPMVSPNDLVVGGWDISKMSIGDAMRRSKVLDWNLQEKLRPHLEALVPLPSIYFPDFIAANQGERADNILRVRNRTS
jgi:myo-inositol-1-phosphate synthase